MPAKANPIPDGFHTITPYLIVDGAQKIIGFMQKAFGAEYTHEPTKRPDGTIMHATLKIGDSMVMVSDSSEHTKAMPKALLPIGPRSLEQLREAILQARGDGLAVSTSGSRHSMGGQQFGAGMVLLDTRDLNRVGTLDPGSQTIEAEAGIEWPDTKTIHLR